MMPGPNSTEPALQPLLDRLCDRTADVVFFPVRHHSPMCALLVDGLIEEIQPAAVLIEGPSDYNEHLDELLLDHQLPIAIYSYFQSKEGETSGAYYPFCEYSPEWVALRAATRCGAMPRFIDLPWSEMIAEDFPTHRYADAELRRGRYVEMLCQRMEVEDFDDLWDKLIESHEQLSLDDYLRRVHSLCLHIRVWEEFVPVADRRREAFMAEQIREVRESAAGRVLVVTGGFHSSALAGRLEELPCPGLELADEESTACGEPPLFTGIALTTYSYERLDSLTGYNAGMPSPGFYEHAWRQRQDGTTLSHQPLLTELVTELRRRRQVLSTADLIAVEAVARGLAALRGRTHVWRRDLIDGVTSSLIKDELEYGCDSPFLRAVEAVLRGNRRGRLAAGTRMPPLVLDILDQLKQVGLEPKRTPEVISLDLLHLSDRAKSQVLHRLRILEVTGVEFAGGTDFHRRDDLTRLWEQWRLRWSPMFESSCIEASRYGTSLADAASAKLQETAREETRRAALAASLLVEGALAGIESFSDALLSELQSLIEREAEFNGAAEALGHLLYLYCFDEALGTTDHADVGRFLRLAFERTLWLLELMGRTVESLRKSLAGMKGLLETFRRTARSLELNAHEFIAVLRRVEEDAGKPPPVRGAAAAALWTLGAADAERVLADLLLFTEPNDLGDFLTGLFTLAREIAQRNPQLVRTVDRLLNEYTADQFQQALPSLRLAFTFFTPREKHHMLTTLFESLGLKPDAPLADVPASAETAAAALAIDERIFEAIRLHGLEPFDDREGA